MTPKEKAIDLFDKYFDEMLSLGFHLSNRQICKITLVAVDEIIKTLNYDIKDLDVRGNVLLDLIKYWREVKQEIENL